MNIKELVEQLAKNNPNALAGVPERKVAPLVRGALAEILAAIESTDEGIVTVGGLGKFNVRKVEREVDGEKIARKQVVFRPAKAKAPAAKAKVGAKARK